MTGAVAYASSLVVIVVVLFIAIVEGTSRTQLTGDVAGTFNETLYDSVSHLLARITCPSQARFTPLFPQWFLLLLLFNFFFTTFVFTVVTV